MNNTKAQKQKSILEELAALAASWGVEAPKAQFDQRKCEYDTGTHVITFDDRAYNKVGRTLLYHEFTHHLLNVKCGMPETNHSPLFWEHLDLVTKIECVDYPWLTEYVNGVRYYERNIIPRLSPRKRAAAQRKVYQLRRLSKEAA